MVNGSFQQIEPLETLLDRTRLNQTTFSNPGNLKVSAQAQDILPSVIVKAQTWMKEERHSFENKINPQLNEHLDRLELLKSRHKREIQLHFDDLNIAETIKTRRKGEREREVEQLFAEYMEWIEDTMSTEEQAYIKVVAVLQGG